MFRCLIKSTSQPSVIFKRNLSSFVDNEVYIVSATRSPIGSFRSKLASLSAPQIGAQVVRAVLAKSGLQGDRKLFFFVF